jgi:hypothetical protein
MKITVKSNIDQVLKRIGSYHDAVLTEAVPLALNRAADAGRVAASREIRSAGYRFRAGEVKDAIRIKRASRYAKSASLIVSRKAQPLIEFEAFQTSRGVHVLLAGKWRIVQDAFIATTKSGHKGVFIRAPNAKHRLVKKAGPGGRAVWSQLPIKELFGPSIGGAFATARVQNAVGKVMSDTFSRRLEHELKRIWKKEMS